MIKTKLIITLDHEPNPNNINETSKENIRKQYLRLFDMVNWPVSIPEVVVDVINV